MIYLLLIYIISLSYSQDIIFENVDSLLFDIESKIYTSDLYLNYDLEEKEVNESLSKLNELKKFCEKNITYENNNLLGSIYRAQYLIHDHYTQNDSLALLSAISELNFEKNRDEPDSLYLFESYQNIAYHYYNNISMPWGSSDIKIVDKAIAYLDTTFNYSRGQDKKDITALIAWNLFELWENEKNDSSQSKFYLGMATQYSKIYNNHHIQFLCLYQQAYSNQLGKLSETMYKIELAREYALKHDVINRHPDEKDFYIDMLHQLLYYYLEIDYNYESKIIIDELDEIKYKNTEGFILKDYEVWLDFLQIKFTIYDFFGIDINEEYDSRLSNEKNKIKRKIESNNDLAILSSLYFILYKIQLVDAFKSDDFKPAMQSLEQAIHYNNISILDKQLNYDQIYNYVYNAITLYDAKATLYEGVDYNNNDYLEIEKTCQSFLNKLEYWYEEYNDLYFQMYRMYEVMAGITLAKYIPLEIISKSESRNQAIKYYQKAKLCLLDQEREEAIILDLDKSISNNYYWLEDFDQSEKYNLLAIKTGEENNLDRQLERLYYQRAEIYIQKNNFNFAISNLQKAKEKHLKNINSIEKTDLSNKDKKNYINRETRINQLLSYCYHKLRLTELLIINSDYFKSYTTKSLLNIDPDLTLELYNLQKSLSENEAIIAYTNIDTEELFESTDINKLRNPIIIYVDKYQYKSFFMFDSDNMNDDIFFEDQINYCKTCKSNIYNNTLDMLQNYTNNNSLKLNANTKILYNQLIKPCENILLNNEISKITIIPESHLYKIPFGVLIDNNDKYLAEKFEINYASSFSMLIDKNEEIKENIKVLAIGNPQYEDDINNYSNLSAVDLTRQIKIKDIDNSNLFNEFYNLGYKNFSNLPGTEKEIKIIEEIFPNTTSFTKKNASELNVKDLSKKAQLKEYNIIHFACHGFYNEEYPHLSSLVLSTDNIATMNDDGFLTLNEISNLELSSNFVNLSACKTARGEMYALEGVDGFIQSFFNAGAQSILSTLWSIEDESAKIFMESFYNNYKSTKSFSQAINKTKSSFINGDFGNKYKDPYFWSPYVYFYRK